MHATRQTRPDPHAPLLPEVRAALEKRDFDALAALFAEDAVLEEVSALNPPAHPAGARGREAILKHLRDEVTRDPVSGWQRSVTGTAVVEGLETDDALAFAEVRTYEAGDQAVAQHIMRKRNGRIEHDRVMVAWDAEG